jgi:nucleotide-binding universal stress UspA family protein
MNKKNIRHVVCAVRGGPESRRTVSYAIDLALEHQAHLTFFHVLDAEFMGHATIGPLGVVYNELVEMGTFAMLILCDRAQRRGVEQSDFIVREGNVRTQLSQFVAETDAELFVIGKPTRSPGKNVIKLNEFENFIASLEAAGKLKIIAVPPKLDEPS